MTMIKKQGMVVMTMNTQMDGVTHMEIHMEIHKETHMETDSIQREYSPPEVGA